MSTLNYRYYGGCPTILRADRGTENSIIAFIQPFFRHGGDDAFAGQKSFMYGRSTANQVKKFMKAWSYLDRNSYANSSPYLTIALISYIFV